MLGNTLVSHFAPFRALRYARANLDDLIAPPYDVIDAAARAALLDRHPANAVRIDFPRRDGTDVPPAKGGPTDGYEEAHDLLSVWQTGGTLRLDARPTFSIYRMTAVDAQGRQHITTGVIGALTLEEPGRGSILPHEETTSKDKADRLNLIRATRINTSPIWGLSMARGLASKYQPEGRPDATATDDDGVLHELWILRDAARGAAISEAVATAPVVIADGHHRFETALAYQQEQESVSVADAATPAGADALLCFLVELAPSELEVRPIHRIVTVPSGPVDQDSLIQALDPWFEAGESLRYDPADDVEVIQALLAAGGLAYVGSRGARVLRPRPSAFRAGITLDSERARVALEALTPSTVSDVRYHHSVATVTAAAAGGRDFGLLLRPATVQQIGQVAETRSRMPAKTTFFWPKPRSGMVFRPLMP